MVNISFALLLVDSLLCLGFIELLLIACERGWEEEEERKRGNENERTIQRTGKTSIFVMQKKTIFHGNSKQWHFIHAYVPEIDVYTARIKMLHDLETIQMYK